MHVGLRKSFQHAVLLQVAYRTLLPLTIPDVAASSNLAGGKSVGPGKKQKTPGSGRPSVFFIRPLRRMMEFK